jgi:hypothetical protein
MFVTRLLRLLAALGGAITALVLTHPALAAPLAQSSSASDDRMKVIIWTLLTVAGALILTAIGYVYRRFLGIDKPPPVTLLEPGRKITGD